MTDTLTVIDKGQTIVVEISNVSNIPGPAGPPGPVGPAGPPRSISYVHYQAVLATVWYVNHNLGWHPWVQAEDGAGTLIFGTVRHLSDYQLTVTFSNAVTGRVNCM